MTKDGNFIWPDGNPAQPYPIENRTGSLVVGKNAPRLVGIREGLDTDNAAFLD